MDIDKLNKSAKEAIKAFPWLGREMEASEYEIASSLLSIITRGNDDDFVEEFASLISVLVFSLAAYIDKEEKEYYQGKAADPSEITQEDIVRLEELLRKKLIH